MIDIRYVFSQDQDSFRRRCVLQLACSRRLLYFCNRIIILPIRLVLRYLGSNALSTENDINMGRAKAWNAIDRLSIIWKSDLSDKMKTNFSKQWLCQQDVSRGR